MGQANIKKVVRKPLGEITEEDAEGHQTLGTMAERVEKYCGYYGNKVDEFTEAKLIQFTFDYKNN
jgi:hypothetical protein